MGDERVKWLSLWNGVAAGMVVIGTKETVVVYNHHRNLANFQGFLIVLLLELLPNGKQG
jgi:hypothetical protein